MTDKTDVSASSGPSPEETLALRLELPPSNPPSLDIEICLDARY